MVQTRLFVYGTLKPGEVSYHLCEASVVESHPAIALGQLYHLPLGYPAMTLGRFDPVHGVVLSFQDAAILSILDDYEQHAPTVLGKYLPPGHSMDKYQYRRQEVQIYDSEKNPCGIAWAYIMPVEQVRHLGGIWVANGCWSGRVVYCPSPLS
jgi:gamma-glutamylcyclotransferase (GGCT)/AIG2-like uncharacterized protein YtfP